jgi:hypothetical protein
LDPGEEVRGLRLDRRALLHRGQGHARLVVALADLEQRAAEADVDEVRIRGRRLAEQEGLEELDRGAMLARFEQDERLLEVASDLLLRSGGRQVRGQLAEPADGFASLRRGGVVAVQAVEGFGGRAPLSALLLHRAQLEQGLGLPSWALGQGALDHVDALLALSHHVVDLGPRRRAVQRSGLGSGRAASLS